MTAAPPHTADSAALASRLLRDFGGSSGRPLLKAMIRGEFAGDIGLLSSFGADSAVLLHMVASIDRDLPVLFLDTGKLFGETKQYRDRLVDRLGLSNVRNLQPDPVHLAAHDPKGLLWASNPDHCCHLRKVAPLENALEGIGAVISGRKRFQSDLRRRLPVVEAIDGRIRINPLAPWSKAAILGYLEAYDLPRHPLVAEGFPSIGCMPCTSRVRPGEDDRAGRWRGQDKNECGIHIAVAGGKQVVRRTAISRQSA